MSKETDVAVLRRIYASIIQGYGLLHYKDSTIFVRHFSPIEQAEIDEQYLSILDNAKAKGLLPEEERLKELFLEKLWTKEDETDIENKKFYISNLNDTKRAEFLPSRIKLINDQIEEGTEKLRVKLTERYSLLGMTAESFANQKLNEIYIYKSFYKDKDFREAFFTPEEYDDLERDEISYLVNLYNQRVQDYADRNLRRVALSQFFQNYFSLCEDNVFNLYGKAIVSLTFYQSELATYGRYFKSILTGENRPPSDIRDDPDKIMDWATGNQNARKVIAATQKETGEGGGMAIMGATSSDLEELGLRQKKPENAKTIQEVAKERGGSIPMEELMKMSGVKK